MKSRVLAVLALAAAVALVAPELALAAAVPSPHLAFPVSQVGVLVVGALVPLVTYALNHFAPWVTESIKAVVLLVVSAAAAAIYTAIATNVLGWNDATLQLILTGIVSSLGAHGLLYRPAGINVRLGGGTNAPARKARRGAA